MQFTDPMILLTINIEVKTTKDKTADGLMSKKEEEYFQLLWYVLVRVHGGYYILGFCIFQSSHIGPWLRNHHQSWLSKSKRNGEPRKDGNMRLSVQQKMNYQ